MIQYELFLKELSDFLRSCTIKNKYFAKRIADQVIHKYGFSSLPDKFNPYYLRMCGLSTLDLKIPKYLIDDQGNYTFNSDFAYAKITDPNPQLTRLLMVRPDLKDEDNNGLPVQKIFFCIEELRRQLCVEDLASSGYTYNNAYQKQTKYEGIADTWILKESEDSNGSRISKIKDLHTRIDNLNPNDNELAINIIAGNIPFEDFAKDSSGFDMSLNDFDSTNALKEDLTNYYISKYPDRPMTINKFDGSSSVKFFISNNKYLTEALIVIGTKYLNWYDMYTSYKNNNPNEEREYQLFDKINSTIYNGQYSGEVIDVKYSKINEALGFGEINHPIAGSRINYLRYARCWKCGTNDDDPIIYTETETPNQGDLVYTNENLESTNNNLVLEYIPNVGGEKSFIKINEYESAISSQPRTYTRHKEGDILLAGGTYEFDGLEWIELNVRNLFDEEFKNRFESEFSEYGPITYTTMANPFDKESFDETLVVGDDKSLFLDRYIYTGWDKPVYVPTYDVENILTRDFTLYTRFHNHMKDTHVRTALKYHIGSDVYSEACEKYTNYIDFIKGVCYPVHALSDRLSYTYGTDIDNRPAMIATEVNYNRYINSIESAIENIAKAKNFSLLAYDSTLLRENEADSIINVLEQTLSCLRERWDIGEFGYEELYYSAVWACIWAHLPYILLVQRILNLRTESVHIDHIWEYLESKGLKDYRTVMDSDQQVFLYKNMEYLRGNEGKQRTLKILVDKLLSKFGATVNTKSVLLDTTNARENKIPSLHDGTQNINGLKESVSASVKILSEDLDDQTSVISDTQGRIEDFDETYRREYVSGLEPYYGNSLNEQMQRVATAHDEIEIKRHTYAPTKLAEITQKDLPSDVARLAMSFIFQTLARKLSGNEISPSCTVNVMFTGLSTPKTFTIGESLALIFYAIRKSDWYTYKNKYGEQNRNEDIWAGLVDESGSTINSTTRKAFLDRLNSYETCPKSSNTDYESDCDHSFYIPNETFNDTIPCRTNIWLPYLGPYTEHILDKNNKYVYTKNGDLATIRIDAFIPESDTGITEFIGNPSIQIADKTLTSNAAERQLLQIVDPIEYKSLNLQSWNDMVAAENNIVGDTRQYELSTFEWDPVDKKYKFVVSNKKMPDSVPEKFDACTQTYRKESNTFIKVSSDYVGGVISGSTKNLASRWQIQRIPDVKLEVNTHADLIENLVDQANFMINHFQMVRNSSDAFFHTAMRYIYKQITVLGYANNYKNEIDYLKNEIIFKNTVTSDSDEINETDNSDSYFNEISIALDLVPGHKTFTSWFETDVELKSVFRDIEEGADQAVIYNSIADSFIEALFPMDMMNLTGGVNQTKYAAMKELFQWLGSYNLAYLNTSSVQYETLFTHPITVNATHVVGENNRAWVLNKTLIDSDVSIDCCAIDTYNTFDGKKWFDGIIEYMPITGDKITKNGFIYIFDGTEWFESITKTKYDPFVGDKIVKKRDLKHLNHYGLNVLTLRDFNIDIKFDKLIGKSEWCVINSGWSFIQGTTAKRVTQIATGTSFPENDTVSAILIYGSKENASKVPVFEIDEDITQSLSFSPIKQYRMPLMDTSKNPPVPITGINFKENDKTTPVLIYGSKENASKIQRYGELKDLIDEFTNITKFHTESSNMTVGFSHTWTSNSKPDNAPANWDTWNNSNVDFTSGSKSYIGAVEYEETDDANTYHQIGKIPDDGFTPIFIKFNNN